MNKEIKNMRRVPVYGPMFAVLAMVSGAQAQDAVNPDQANVPAAGDAEKPKVPAATADQANAPAAGDAEKSEVPAAATSQFQMGPAASGANTDPVRYKAPSGASVELYVFVGLDEDVAVATTACASANGARDKLLAVLHSDEYGLEVLRSSVAAPAVMYKNYMFGLCGFQKAADSNEWTYVHDLGAIGITQIDVVDKNGRGVSLGNNAQDEISGWLKPGGPYKTYALSSSAIYDRASGKWPYQSQAGIRFLVGNGSGGYQIPVYVRVMTQVYPHFSIAVANSYGAAFGEGGRVVAMPLTVAGGVDILVAKESDFFIGVRAIAAPAVAFQDGALSSITSLAVGARIDLDQYVGIGGGPQIDITNGKVRGMIFVSIGPGLLNVLNLAK